MTFIDPHRDSYGVEPICAQLPIAPSAYHEGKAQAKRSVVVAATCSARCRVVHLDPPGVKSELPRVRSAQGVAHVNLCAFLVTCVRAGHYFDRFTTLLVHSGLRAISLMIAWHLRTQPRSFFGSTRGNKIDVRDRRRCRHDFRLTSLARPAGSNRGAHVDSFGASGTRRLGSLEFSLRECDARPSPPCDYRFDRYRPTADGLRRSILDRVQWRNIQF